MVEPQSVSDVLKRLAKEGFTEDFRADKLGLRAATMNILINPDDVVVEKIYRFEGETDLNDEEIIFAISCPKHSIKGTYLVAFGVMMHPTDAEIVSRLKKKGQCLL